MDTFLQSLYISAWPGFTLACFSGGFIGIAMGLWIGKRYQQWLDEKQRVQDAARLYMELCKDCRYRLRHYDITPAVDEMSRMNSQVSFTRIL